MTTFITFVGKHEWLRVPVRLKGAASYFQQVIATVILVGFGYTVFELYMDNVIVHGQQAEDFSIFFVRCLHASVSTTLKSIPTNAS